MLVKERYSRGTEMGVHGTQDLDKLVNSGELRSADTCWGSREEDCYRKTLS